MPTISEQNNLQIRQPMDVLITMQVPDDDVTLTFSGYASTAKVADGVLAQKSWPMRTLADLQGDGFALNGSAVLYDPSTSASQANGKLGVRGNIGQPVSLTVTGSQYVEGLTAAVTGAESVAYGGRTISVVADRAIIPLASRSGILVFNPASDDTRVEISDVIAGVDLIVTNENLISCVLSLRSDLSPVDPTLPESEINIEVYNETDIADVVAQIPDDSPIYYQSGYDDDLSDRRQFYVSGQATWADGVLSIHGVDAVHKLEGQTVYPVLLGNIDSYGRGQTSVNHLPLLVYHELQRAGIRPEVEEEYFWKSGAPARESVCVVTEQPARDLVAFLNNMHLISIRFVEGIPNFWPTFVDAGRPKLTYLRPEPKWDIYESDCGETKRNVEKKVDAYRYNQTAATLSNKTGNSYVQVGTGTWIKGSGIFIDPDEYVYFATARYDWDNGFVINIPGWVTGENGIVAFQGAVVPDIDGMRIGLYLLGPGIPKGTMSDSSYDWNTQVLPWSGNSSMWTRYVEAHQPGAEQADITLLGSKVVTDTTEGATYGDTSGNVVDIDLGNIIGVYRFGRYDLPTGSYLAFPDLMLRYLLQRSNITGSFTWKGDPRMQPRDVVNFRRLDGTIEQITIETITLKHEGGGTTAEITYREGIV